MKCDNCSKEINYGEPTYAFYSDIEMMGIKTGNMLVCEACTNRIMTDKAFAAPKKHSGKIDMSTISKNPNIINELNEESIISRCKAFGMTPAEAKLKARELAKEFEKDNQKGQDLVYNFWTSNALDRATPSTPTEYKSDSADLLVADNIEVMGEGETLEEAREKAKSKLPKNFGQYTKVETIIQDVIGAKRYIGDTITEAYKEAEKELDKNAKIIEKKEIHTPEKKVISISAISDDGLIDQAKSRINDSRFSCIRRTAKVAGKKGFLGIGKVMGQYEFEFLRPAEVEVTYRQKAVVMILLFKTVKIGAQVWMQRNLEVDRYRNGDLIPEVKDEEEWAKLKTGAWCYYENDSKNGEKYGKLYNWYAVNDPRGLAPKGWHIPTVSEFETLKSSVSENSNALKSIEQGSGVGAVTNSSGFSALLAGTRYYPGTFYGLGYYASFWSSTENDATGAYVLSLDYYGSYIYLDYGTKESGFSVRCLKD